METRSKDIWMDQKMERQINFCLNLVYLLYFEIISDYTVNLLWLYFVGFDNAFISLKIFKYYESV